MAGKIEYKQLETNNFGVLGLRVFVLEVFVLETPVPECHIYCIVMLLILAGTCSGT